VLLFPLWTRDCFDDIDPLAQLGKQRFLMRFL
jgi:hypothetical protein